MKNQIIFCIFIFFMILSPAFTQDYAPNELIETDLYKDIAPPEWILGTWIIDEEEAEDPFIIEFTEDDIIMDYYSMIEDILSGYVVEFVQEITEEYYDIYLKFDNEEWYRERFFLTSEDTMESEFTASDGSELSFSYYRYQK